MKITIGLTKRAEALLRDLITGESFELEEIKAERADAIALAESRRLDLVAKDRELNSLSTQERQRRMALEAAEGRLTEIRGMAMGAVTAADASGSGAWPGNVPTPMAALRSIVQVTRR